VLRVGRLRDYFFIVGHYSAVVSRFSQVSRRIFDFSFVFPLQESPLFLRSLVAPPLIFRREQLLMACPPSASFIYGRLLVFDISQEGSFSLAAWFLQSYSLPQESSPFFRKDRLTLSPFSMRAGLSFTLPRGCPEVHPVVFSLLGVSRSSSPKTVGPLFPFSRSPYRRLLPLLGSPPR